MSSILWNITLDCADPGRISAFWAAVTGWPAAEAADGEYMVQPPDGTRPQLYFTTVPEPRRGKNRMHLDVVPADRDQQAEITRLTALGATVVSDRRPEYGWVIMADPEGNEFCLEPSLAEIEQAEQAEQALLE